MTDRIVFWGTGDSMGVPRVNCRCGICTEARNTGANRRFRSSLLLETSVGALLIDCGPDWPIQMERFDYYDMKRLLITHTHFDHVGGIPQWTDCYRWTGEKGIVYAPSEVIRSLTSMYPWLSKQLDYQSIDDGFRFGAWSIRPWKVNHGNNGTSFAYLFDDGAYRWAYCSDAFDLSPAEKAGLADQDLLILGTNYYEEKKDRSSRSVYDMLEGMALTQEIRARQCIFTHMSHDIDLRQTCNLPAHIRRALTGMAVDLGQPAGS